MSDEKKSEQEHEEIMVLDHEEVPGYRPLATQWVSRERVGEARFDLVLQPLDE